jgi:hypothetical protein
VRDDIHRKLPLPSPWRGFVKTCTRDSERAERPARAAYAAVCELRDLTPALLKAAKQAEQRPLFGVTGLDPKLEALAASPIDQAFVRELAITKEGDRLRAVERALDGALRSRMEAQRREIWIHTALTDPQNCAAVLANVDVATANAGLSTLVASYVGTQKLPGRYRRPALDVDESLLG